MAKQVTSKDNYWFSAAFVNRIWGELMGQAFYQPVDNMGPLQDATFPGVLLRLAGSFRSTDYNVKQLYRVILNTEVYQRQTRIGESAQDHLKFAASYPTRLHTDALWDSLVNVLGEFENGPAQARLRQQQGKAARFLRAGLQGQFGDMFDFDPSTKSDEVEGTVPQALMLMNNQQFNGRIRATGTTILAGILKKNPDDEGAIKTLYLHALARKPSDRELQICVDYIRETKNRNEAYEDLLWSLINSTEFQTRR